jgi:hypothetical protein
MKNFRDIEQLSSYLDGQLSPSQSTRIKSRLSSDPELASAFNDIRAARSILRKLPSRKAPRNFTLTRQMVGLKPPLPRSYSFFRFSTAFATVLLVLTFAANLIVPNISLGASAPVPMAAPEFSSLCNGCGGGPAATEAPMAAAAPSLEMAVTPTESLPATTADSARVFETPMAEAPIAKEPGNVPESQTQPQASAGRESVVPVAWQIGLLAVGLISLLIMLALRQSAIQKWK